MTNFPGQKILAMALLSGFVAACNNSPPSRVSFGTSNGPTRGSSNGEGDVLGEDGSDSGDLPGGGTDAGAGAGVTETPLKLSLSSAADHDAYDYTFGLGKISFETSLANARLTIKRGYLVKKDATLSAEQKAFAARLCKDIAVSAKADAFEEAQADKGEDLYLVWRSHFGADVKLFLSDYLAKEGEPLNCIATVSLVLGDKKESANLVFNALADKDDDLIGSAKMENALKEGLLLASSVIPEGFPEHQIQYLDEAAKIQWKVAALNQLDVKVETETMAGAEQCYLIASGGTTKPYNPKSKSGMNYKVTTKSEFATGAAQAKAIDGRAIKECAAVKLEAKDAAIGMSLTCGDYFAIKDQGLEAGCAWDLPLVNTLDAENSLAVAIALDKFAVKTRDGAKVSAQTSDSIIPISAINDIRDGKVNISALSKGQAQLIEDALDLWIAIDEKAYRESFYNHIKTIGWDGNCSYGAYAQYGSEMVTWCAGGALTENYTARRFQDPNLLLYRAILAWHEVRHTLNLKHDVDDKSYQPCAGTAGSARLAVSLMKNCTFDYCKQVKPSVVSNYKSELNYDYNGDNSGRKSQGDCKAWSTELGVSGGGF